MAGEWIKMRTNLRTDPRIVSIAAAVRKSKEHVIGACHTLWSIADEHSVEGRLPGYTTGALDAEVGTKGFAAALKAVDWLRVVNGGLVIPRFDEHNGASAKRRAEDQQRKRRGRGGALDPPNVRNLSANCPHENGRSVVPEERERRGRGESSPAGEEAPPRGGTLNAVSIFEAWRGSSLGAGGSDAVYRAWTAASGNAAVCIDGEADPVPAGELWCRCALEAAAKVPFRGIRPALGYVTAIFSACMSEGRWPGDERGKGVDGLTPGERALAELDRRATA